MKMIVLCKDCGEQFESPHPKGKIFELQEKAITSSISLCLSSCMGICPSNMISSLEIKEDEINPFKIIPLKPEDILLRIKMEKH